MILILGLAVVASNASAQGGTVVKLDPASSAVDVGGTVVVNVVITNVRNLAGAEVHILYDPFVVEAQIEPGGFPAPDQVFQSSATGGRIDFAITQMPQQHQPVSGSGVLLKITLKGLVAGTSVLHVTSAVLSDGSGALIPSTTLEGSVTVILGSISG
ncbi:MAG TPA: cohesin domain-containing protein, partial [Anaerolineae bacterium]|nr:cohesin domain-containing protein [Anaerolineae bacterium]